jgi:hypothetical protein
MLDFDNQVFISRPSELLDRIETTGPTAIFPEGVVVDLPSSFDSILELHRRPKDPSQLKWLANDLTTYTADLSQALVHRMCVLSDLRGACRRFEFDGEAADTESLSDLRANLATALVGASQMLDTRLPRPPESVLSSVDRAQLAIRVRQYAWNRFDLCREIESTREAIGSTQRKVNNPRTRRTILKTPPSYRDISWRIERSSTGLDAAGVVILRSYESALMQWLACLNEQSNAYEKLLAAVTTKSPGGERLEWRAGYLGLEFHDGGKIVRRAGKEVHLAKSRLGWGIVNKLEQSQQSRVAISGLTAIWNDVGRTDTPNDHGVSNAVYDLNKRIKPLGIQADYARDYGYTLIESDPPPGPTTAPQEQVKETPQSKQAKPVKKAARSARRKPKGS